MLNVHTYLADVSARTHTCTHAHTYTHTQSPRPCDSPGTSGVTGGYKQYVQECCVTTERDAGLLCAIDGVFLLRLGLLHVIDTWMWSMCIYIYQQGIVCVVNGVMRCGKCCSMWFVAMMFVYTGLCLLDGVHRCGVRVCVCFYSCGCRAGIWDSAYSR